ncbi:MAG TPA: MqnA/MqnD/SBP family protein [Candidatus Saccharimonadales bacterium]|nr:MqnA/MqnD/SBP family protein [Candidatus Saccharimonadales bacterium]
MPTPSTRDTETRTITLGHSPDPDDAFMFHGLLSGKVPCEGLRFEQVIEGIESLNRKAIRGEIDFTAASVHACGVIGDGYRILDTGAAMGDGYGPVLVSKEPMRLEQLSATQVAIPGILTTAYLTLRLAARQFQFKVVPFDQVLEDVEQGHSGAALVIHEGQVTYESRGFHKILDLGEWWKERTGLPLPLGVNIVRAGLGDETIRSIGRALHESVEYAFAHRAEALAHAREFGRGLDEPTTDRFVGMYVNDWTLSMGEKGRAAIERLLSEGREKGLIPDKPGPVFAGV